MPRPTLALLLLAFACDAGAAAFYKDTRQQSRLYIETGAGLSKERAAEVELAVEQYRAVLKGCVELVSLGKPQAAVRAAALAEAAAGTAGYISFKDGPICSEDCVGAGRIVAGACDWNSPGEQTVSVSHDCGYAYLLHELGHKMGLIHEHNRPERTRFLLFHKKNLHPKPPPGYDLVGSFKPALPADLDVYGSFDYLSIMMYGSCEFSVTQDEGCKGKPVLTRLDGSVFPQPAALSPSDKAGLRAHYGCR